MSTEEKKSFSVYFLRHGESRFNAGMGDERNSDLSPVGKIQAGNVRANVDLVITSPLKRAIETFHHSKIVTKELYVSSLCREHKNVSNCDYFEGEPKIEETIEQVMARIEEFRSLLFLLGKTYKNILVVTHSGFIQKFLKQNFILGNCQYTEWSPLVTQPPQPTPPQPTPPRPTPTPQKPVEKN